MGMIGHYCVLLPHYASKLTKKKKNLKRFLQDDNGLESFFFLILYKKNYTIRILMQMNRFSQVKFS